VIPVRLRGACALPLCLAVAVSVSTCAPKRLAVVGPLSDLSGVARGLEVGTRVDRPVRVDFRWQLNESGSRVEGAGVARIEPPYRARLDLFLDNGESVIAAALVDDDLRLPPGAPDDLLPPVDLMWGVLGVFRPMRGTHLAGGDRLEGGAERLRYRYDDGTEVHYEVAAGRVSALELLEDGSIVQWVRLSGQPEDRYPISATYRNLVDFRELKITRESIQPAESFDPAIWDPR